RSRRGQRERRSFPTRRSSDLEPRDVTANDFPVNITESTHPAASPPAEGELRVTLLGTGSPIPSTERFGFSVLVQAGENNYVVDRSEEHTSELQSRENLVCRLL